MAEETTAVVDTDTTKDQDTKQTDIKTDKSFEELQKEFDALKAAQSGSDKKVRELLATLKQKEEAEEKASEEKLTQEQRLARLEQENEKAIAAANRQEQITLAVKELTSRGLPVTRAEKLAGKTTEETMANIEAETKDLAEFRQKILDEALGKSGREIGDGGQKKGDTTLYTREQMENMTHEEIIANWEKVQESLRVL